LGNGKELLLNMRSSIQVVFTDGQQHFDIIFFAVIAMPLPLLTSLTIAIPIYEFNHKRSEDIVIMLFLRLGMIILFAFFAEKCL
jgi:hypothetical protein